MFKLLIKYIKPYWWQAILLVVAVTAQVYCTLSLPAFMASIINEGIVAGNHDAIWRSGIFMLLLAAASAVGALVSSYLATYIGANFSKDLRRDIFTKVLNFNLSDSDKFSVASLITRTTNDVNQVQQTAIMILNMMLRAPLFCIISLIRAFQTAPEMSWIIAVAVAGTLGSIILIMSLVIPKFKIFQKLLDKITLITRENLTGLRVIRAFNNEKIEKEKFEKTNQELTKTIIFVDRIIELQNPLINIIFNGTALLCIAVGTSLLTKDVAFLGNMTAFSEYVTQFMISILMLSILFIMLPRASVSAHRINDVLKNPNHFNWKKSTVGVPSIVPSVEFKDVIFSYNGASDAVLSNISFKAEAGKTTAFIGSTGSGKSTLINLIPRFYEASSGEILVNGINVKDFEKDDLMKRIGFVPQRGALFSGTIKSNISFGAPNATMKEIEKAAEISESAEFIKKLADGYNHHIAEGGTNVSGGQKQRLSIARAICKNPEIYIFDDSFSALDMKTDKKLRAGLKPITKNSVVLIVAQRINTIKDADQIVVLDQGKVVDTGTHLELLKNCKVYNEIVKSQYSDAEYAAELKEANA
ncbi:MAG: ABC transporter ATP-binding protein/permease [Candidatus Saccharibacteria bacterium]|nr:ABC transporter ATP-binding protein/permease [Candidatus Saccharibacteria bacterium]